MAFARKVWRLLVGIKDALTLIFLLLFFYALFAVLSARPSPAAVRDGALLLQLDGTVVEEVAPIDPFSALLSSAVPAQQYAARDLVRAIDEAAKDERITAIALDLSAFTGGGQVHMQAIGEALGRFRTAGKPVLTYAILYSDDAMQLAAHASEVWVDPLGGAVITGPGGDRLYYAGLIERLKINAHIYRVGTYKSAVEPYSRSDMSPAARENSEALYGALWSEWQANVKQARPQVNIDRVTKQIPEWLEASNGDLAQAAMEAGFADRTGTVIEWGQRLAVLAGEDNWDDAPGAYAKTELDSWLAEIEPEEIGKAIGVVTIAGNISDGTAGPGESGAQRIVALLDEALDQDLAALVIRVDSPGGTVSGSEAIRRAILRHKAKGIPIVASMANVAASGGYWVSTPADRIFAEPETITGSIGIFGVLPTFENSLKAWGVTADGVSITPLAGQPNLLAGLTPETEAILQSTVEAGYERFLSLVAQSRNITRERADELGQGRVWDGGTARQLGLVDQFGDLDLALQWAAQRAQLGDGKWHTRFLGADADPYASVLAQFLGQSGAGTHTSGMPAGDILAMFAKGQHDLTNRLLIDLDGLLQARGMQARCLECPVSGSAPAARVEQPQDSILRHIGASLFD